MENFSHPKEVAGSAAVMRVSDQGTIGGIDTVDVSIFEAHAEAELSPMYAGASAGFNLAGGEVSIFDFNLGVGASTGAGIKDESIELELVGTGVTVGRKISISVLDCSFGIDLIRTKDAVFYVRDELKVAVAQVPGAMVSAGNDLVDEAQKMPGEVAQAGKDLGHEVQKTPGEFADAGKSLGEEIIAIPGAFAKAGKDIWKTFF